MKNKILAAVAASVVVLALGACNPQFPSGAALTADNVEPYVVLNWTPANALDAGESIDAYRIDVDGVEVSRVPGWASGCVLKGLENSTNYTISVTAYDTKGQWTGPGAGTLTRAHTTQYTGDSGPDVFCDTAPPPPPPE